jgi:hypothetical protein
MTERGFSIQCLLRWLKIREAEGHSFPVSVKQLETDIAHSALLTRLLNGQEPLPEPPPKSSEYPWYDIVEKGKGEPNDVWEAEDDLEQAFGYKALVIDKHPWRILRKISDEEFIVTYGKSDSQWLAKVVGVREDIQEHLREGHVDAGFARLAKRWVVEQIHEVAEGRNERIGK